MSDQAFRFMTPEEEAAWERERATRPVLKADCVYANVGGETAPVLVIRVESVSEMFDRLMEAAQARPTPPTDRGIER